ncbi:DUF336 domain-containing protein [Dichomitus squalens]|uniref:DUF336 domain-containing protein n=1 Tax=Dichomitus squalens TaxID=114155 RepID=A0A4Q9MJY5_9APHY|nr:DUF336 domain-containing protein [Dichomitus squalens]TBU50594.1 DUF336 domain-containing protein [Dichomitus squalens]TBU61215.1 DUF336 domain-containing protein [Dichomitus squalens]
MSQGQYIAIRAPPVTLEDIAAQEQRCIFPHFTADTAWELGTRLRARLQRASPKPAVVNITLAAHSQLLFHCATGRGTTADNDTWVARKRAAVLRWHTSTWFLHNKHGGNEDAFRAKFMLGEKAGEYAIHGGGFPIRVRDVEGIVGVIVVSGLTMQEDHEVIVEVIEEYLASL